MSSETHFPVTYADQGEFSYLLVDKAGIARLQHTAFDGFDLYHVEEAPRLVSDEAGNRVEGGGLVVADITLNVGLPRPVTVMQLSDLHFNHLNEKDWEEANPTLLSTYERRGFGKGNLPLVRKAVEFVRDAHQVVVTGDGIDYLSHGTLELLHREVWDKLPAALICGGNHEYEQQMQGAVADTLTMEQKMAWVKSAWKHEYEYTARLVEDAVVVIQMDDGRRDETGHYGFAAGTAARLQADLLHAREKGRAVLLFMHVPLATGNLAETEVRSHFANDVSNRTDEPYRTRRMNFCDNQLIDHKTGRVVDEPFVGGAVSSAETAAVMQLITTHPDVIKGVFTGHKHAEYYTEIAATAPDGTPALIPQYTMTGTGYTFGHVTKITLR